MVGMYNAVGELKCNSIIFIVKKDRDGNSFKDGNELLIINIMLVARLNSK